MFTGKEKLFLKSSRFYQLDNHILQQVPENPYLGITLSEDLKWSSHINKISKKASSKLGYDVYISQLIRFARVSSHVDDFNTRNKVLTAKLLRQGYRYHKIRKAFSKFYRRHFDIVSKYNVGLKALWKAFQNLNFMGTWCINSEK